MVIINHCLLCVEKPPPTDLKIHLMYHHMIENDLEIERLITRQNRKHILTQTTVTWTKDYDYYDDKSCSKPLHFKKSKNAKRKGFPGGDPNHKHKRQKSDPSEILEANNICFNSQESSIRDTKEKDFFNGHTLEESQRRKKIMDMVIENHIVENSQLNETEIADFENKNNIFAKDNQQCDQIIQSSSSTVKDTIGQYSKDEFGQASALNTIARLGSVTLVRMGKNTEIDEQNISQNDENTETADENNEQYISENAENCSERKVYIEEEYDLPDIAYDEGKIKHEKYLHSLERKQLLSHISSKFGNSICISTIQNNESSKEINTIEKMNSNENTIDPEHTITMKSSAENKEINGQSRDEEYTLPNNENESLEIQSTLSDNDEGIVNLVEISCSYCDMNFQSKAEMDDHILVIHEVDCRSDQQEKSENLLNIEQEISASLCQKAFDNNLIMEDQKEEDESYLKFLDVKTDEDEKNNFLDDYEFNSDDEQENIHKEVHDSKSYSNANPPNSSFKRNLIEMKSYLKPPLPPDLIVSIAIKSLKKSNYFPITFNKIITFISLFFPYYNKNLDECKEMVSKIEEQFKTHSEIDDFTLKETIEESLVIRMKSYIRKDKASIENSLLFPYLLNHFIQNFNEHKNTVSLKYFTKENLEYVTKLSLISLCQPCTSNQIVTFMFQIFPSIGNTCQNLETDILNILARCEYVESYQKEEQQMFKLTKHTFSKILQSIKSYFSCSNNIKKLEDNLFDKNFIKEILY